MSVVIGPWEARIGAMACPPQRRGAFLSIDTATLNPDGIAPLAQAQIMNILPLISDEAISRYRQALITRRNLWNDYDERPQRSPEDVEKDLTEALLSLREPLEILQTHNFALTMPHASRALVNSLGARLPSIMSILAESHKYARDLEYMTHQTPEDQDVKNPHSIKFLIQNLDRLVECVGPLDAFAADLTKDNQKSRA